MARQYLHQITLNNGSVVGGAFESISLTDLPAIDVPTGGTGQTSLTAHAVLLGEAAAPVGFATIGTAGRALLDQGAGADPLFKAFSGDATLAGTGALTLATVNGNVGTFGDASNVAQITVDGKGRITAVTNVPIAGGGGGMAIGSPVAGGNSTLVLFVDSGVNLAQDSALQWDSGSKALSINPAGTGGVAIIGNAAGGTFSYGGGGVTATATICDGARAGSFSDFAHNIQFGDGTYAANATAGSVNALGTTGNTYRWNTNASAPATQTLVTLPLNVFGAGAINDLLGDPDNWCLININGTDYKIPVYLP